MSDWKPGEFALVTGPSRFLTIGTPAQENVTVMCRRGEGDVWYAVGIDGRGFTDREVVKVRPAPLVVIDPEDREAVERLLRGYAGWKNSDDIKGYPHYVEEMQAALREFATPKPPKPDEPQGLGAVVEDANGELFILTDPTFKRGWTRSGTNNRVQWCEMDAEPLRVLSEGVRP